MNCVVTIPLATLDEMFRPRDLPIGTYVRNYVLKRDALCLEWISVEDKKEGGK